MSVKDRPRLGRGLKALITNPVGFTASSPAAGQTLGGTTHAAATTPPGAGLAEVALDLIDANPHQPRTHATAMEPAALKELAASIKASGILQPVILRPMPGGRYQLVA